MKHQFCLSATLSLFGMLLVACPNSPQAADGGKNRHTSIPNNNINNTDHHTMDITLLKKLLDDCLKDSQAYSFAEALPLKETVKTTAMQLPDGFWEQLLPEENFFLFELLPELANKANPDIVAEAYCSALSHCVADWWGMPGHFNTDAAKRLTEKKGIEQCLIAALSHKEAITYTDGEANSVASRRGWQVSDLAASFLAQMREVPFNAYQTAEEREKAKKALVE